MKITKNKNPQDKLEIVYRFLNLYPWEWFTFWKSQTFGKSLETFCWQNFCLRILKSIGWYGFSYRFLVVMNVFHKFLLKVITTLKFYNHFFLKDDLQTPAPRPPTPKKKKFTGQALWI